MNTKRPDCLACGVCCWAMEEAKLLDSWGRKHIVEVPWNDPHAWVGTYGAIETKWRTMKAGPLKGREILICEALRGSMLHRVKCSIYEKRPSVCKVTFRPGDLACLKLRRRLVSETYKVSRQEDATRGP